MPLSMLLKASKRLLKLVEKWKALGNQFCAVIGVVIVSACLFTARTGKFIKHTTGSDGGER